MFFLELWELLSDCVSQWLPLVPYVSTTVCLATPPHLCPAATWPLSGRRNTPAPFCSNSSALESYFPQRNADFFVITCLVMVPTDRPYLPTSSVFVCQRKLKMLKQYCFLHYSFKTSNEAASFQSCVRHSCFLLFTQNQLEWC